MRVTSDAIVSLQCFSDMYNNWSSSLVLARPFNIAICLYEYDVHFI